MKETFVTLRSAETRLAGSAGGYTMTAICYNCAYCSEHYPSFRDTCDLTDEEIKDVYTHGCKRFAACEDEEETE